MLAGRPLGVFGVICRPWFVHAMRGKCHYMGLAEVRAGEVRRSVYGVVFLVLEKYKAVFLESATAVLRTSLKGPFYSVLLASREQITHNSPQLPL